VTIQCLAETIARALGVQPTQGTIPLPAARIVATVGDLLPAKLKPMAPLTGSRLDFLTHSRVYDVSKAGRLLGFKADTELQAGIERSVAWYWQEGLLPCLDRRQAP
jgi:nucleoside-diphosphate-sugar epimerase